MNLSKQTVKLYKAEKTEHNKSSLFACKAPRQTRKALPNAGQYHQSRTSRPQTRIQAQLAEAGQRT